MPPRPSNINPNPFTTRPEIEGTFGVVTSTHWIATAVGMATLEKGGNAFDAACATAFTLQVVEPHLNGPGGDVPVIVHDVKRGKTEVICGQGPAPAGATIKHYRDELGLDLIPGTGLLAACIPGTFDTWMTLLRDYGTMRIADVLSPAIGYAKNGYPLVERISATINTVKDQFRDHWPTSAALYMPDGKVPAPGTIFSNAKMAGTYERILREAQSGGGTREAEIERARKSWSQGFVAEAIDEFCRTQEIMDTSGRPHRGVLNGQDMAGWQASVEAPIAYDYGRYTVMKPGPWTQGLVTLQTLALLKGYDLDALSPVSADFIHLQVEATKLAFADRDTFYGDPKFVNVPVDVLLSDAYNDERRKLIGDRASLELRPGTVAGFGKKLDLRLADGARAAVTSSGAGEPTVGRIDWTHDEHHLPDAQQKRERAGAIPGDTVHFDIIDQARQHGVVDALGRLAAFLADNSRARLLSRHPRADVLARRGPSGRAGAGKTPAFDADADDGVARRRALSRLGFARRRPAGPVDHADVPAARPCQHEFAGGDRRAGLALGAFPIVVLAAHGPPRGHGG